MHKFDEMYAQLPFVDSAVRPHYRNYLDWLKRQDPQTMRDRREEAEMIFRRVGMCRTRCIRKSAASTSCERPIRMATASTTCSKTTCACPAA